VQIAINAGKDDAAVIVSKVQSGKANAGYDALTDEIVDDMLVAGIVDPAKMQRMALENSISAAAMILTTEAAIADIPEPKNPPAGGGGMDAGRAPVVVVPLDDEVRRGVAETDAPVMSEFSNDDFTGRTTRLPCPRIAEQVGQTSPI